MAITFTDEDITYLDKERRMKLRSIRQAIDVLKVKKTSFVINASQ